MGLENKLYGVVEVADLWMILDRSVSIKSFCQPLYGFFSVGFTACSNSWSYFSVYTPKDNCPGRTLGSTYQIPVEERHGFMMPITASVLNVMLDRYSMANKEYQLNRSESISLRYFDWATIFDSNSVGTFS